MAHVLVVDDEEMIRVLVRSALETEGHHVEEADCGERAMEVLPAFRPDLVISDIRMAGISGYELLEEVRNRPETSHAPFIFITGSGRRDVYRHGMDLGADDFLEKPFSTDELLASVRTRLQMRKLLEEKSERKMHNLRKTIALALPHEFRTPLNTVLAFSKILHEDPDVRPEELRRFAGMIHAAGRRLHHLVENYLIFAQIELSAADQETLSHLRGESTPHVAALLRSCARDKAAEYGRPGDLSVHAEAGVCAVSHEHLSKILYELIDNAFKFSARGDRVTVSGTPYEESYLVDIEDTGKGMTPGHVSSVDFFQQFGRDNKEQPGVGLGLSIARKLTVLYGGDVTLGSTASGGTRVRVRVPLVPGR